MRRWDDLLSPIGFFTFLDQRMHCLDNAWDIDALLYHLYDHFTSKNDVQCANDDLERSFRGISRTGLARWLSKPPIRDTVLTSELLRQIRQQHRVADASRCAK